MTALRGDWRKLVQAAIRAGWTVEKRASGHTWLRKGNRVVSLSGSDDAWALRNAIKDCERAGIQVRART